MEEIIYLTALLVLSAFFSGAEIALMTLSEFKIRYLQDQQFKGAATLAQVRKDKHRLLVTILIGNNLVNIAASALATKIAIAYFQRNGIGIAVGVMTFLILLVGEITPKAFASVHASRVALTIAPVFKLLILFCLPFIKLFDFISIIVYKSVGTSDQPSITEEEIFSLVRYGEKAGVIKRGEKEMIHNIFKFDDIDVKEIITPRTDIVFVESSISVKETLKYFAEHGYSRLPIYKEELDNIVGILYIKDVLKLLEDGKEDMKAEEVGKPTYFVPETLSIDVLFRRLQKKKVHMAIVVDEYGGVSGLVTLEDLLEEIVGDIFDESDKIDPQITQVEPHTWLIKGNTDIEEVNKELAIAIEEEKSFDTISGHILKLAGKIPVAEEKFEDEFAVYTIVDTERNRISLIKARKK